MKTLYRSSTNNIYSHNSRGTFFLRTCVLSFALASLPSHSDNTFKYQEVDRSSLQSDVLQVYSVPLLPVNKNTIKYLEQNSVQELYDDTKKANGVWTLVGNKVAFFTPNVMIDQVAIESSTKQEDDVILSYLQSCGHPNNLTTQGSQLKLSKIFQDAFNLNNKSINEKSCSPGVIVVNQRATVEIEQQRSKANINYQFARDEEILNQGLLQTNLLDRGYHKKYINENVLLVPNKASISNIVFIAAEEKYNSETADCGQLHSCGPRVTPVGPLPATINPQPIIPRGKYNEGRIIILPHDEGQESIR